MGSQELVNVLDKTTVILNAFFCCQSCNNEFDAHMMRPHLLKGEAKIVCGLCCFVKRLAGTPFHTYDQLIGMINKTDLKRVLEDIVEGKSSPDGVLDCQKCHRNYNDTFLPKALSCGHGICTDCGNEGSCLLCNAQQLTCESNRRFQDLYFLLFLTIKAIGKLDLQVESQSVVEEQEPEPESVDEVEGCCTNCKELVDIKNQFLCLTCKLEVYCSRCIVLNHRSHSIRDVFTETIASKLDRVREDVEVAETAIVKEIDEYFEQVADFEVQEKVVKILDVLASKAASVEVVDSIIAKCQQVHGNYVKLATRFLKYHKKIFRKVKTEEKELEQLLEEIQEMSENKELQQFCLDINNNNEILKDDESAHSCSTVTLLN